jgi:hypothetical protein
MVFGLRNRLQTQASINGRTVPVNYLTNVDSALDLSALQGDLYVGGYQDVEALVVRTGKGGGGEWERRRGRTWEGILWRRFW